MKNVLSWANCLRPFHARAFYFSSLSTETLLLKAGREGLGTRLRCAIGMVYSLTWDTEHIPVSSSIGGILNSWWTLALWNNLSELELQRKRDILTMIKDESMRSGSIHMLKCNFVWNTYSWGIEDLLDTAQTPAPLEICTFQDPPYLLLRNSTNLIQII